jgi:intracellular septation protein A
MAGSDGIKHWRSFGPAEWGHVRDGLLGAAVGGLLPVVLYITIVNTWGFRPAVVAVLTWSALVFFWHRRRTGGIDVFSASAFAFGCVKAAAGLITENERLYLAWPSIENLVYGTTFLGSALVGRPLVALYFQRLYPVPRAVQASHTYRNAFVVVSAAWFCGHLVRAVLRLWLLATLPREVYLFVDAVAGWPITVPLSAFTAWYPVRQLRRIGHELEPQPITPLDAVELVVEESAPSTV